MYLITSTALIFVVALSFLSWNRRAIHRLMFDQVTGKARHFSFVGMSNHGKSYWAEQLAIAFGFRWICIDTLIATHIRLILEAAGLPADVSGLASWMGMPGDAQYEANQAIYLRLEEQLTLEALRNLDPNVPTIIDTTGSVAHLSDELLALLVELTTVVFLDSTDQKRAEARETYLAKPKPVAFVHIWDPLPEETFMESLARCCRMLQAFRDVIYNQLADVIVPYQVHREASLTAREFLILIQPTAS